MTMFFTTIEGLVTFLESYLCFYVSNVIFCNVKLKKYCCKLAVLLTVLILSLNSMRLFPAFTLFFAVFFVSLTEYLILKINFLEAFAVAWVYTIFLNVFDLLAQSLSGIFWNDVKLADFVASGFSMYRVITLLISKSFLLLFCIVLRQYGKNFYYVVKMHRLIIIAIIGSLGGVYLLGFAVSASNINMAVSWGLFLNALFAVCFTMYLYICYEEEKNNNSFIQFHNTVITDHYNVLMKSYEANSQNFHDMQNHLSVLRNYLENNEIIKARSYIEELTVARKFIESSWTGNEVLDYILNLKKMSAKELQIECTIDADLISYQKLSDKVLCVVFSNLLDNAIESCLKIRDKEKFIHIIIREINNMLIIKIVNAAYEIPITRGGIFRTGKNAPQRHGWGLKSVASAVKGNNGEISYDFDKEQFTVSITFF